MLTNSGAELALVSCRKQAITLINGRQCNADITATMRMPLPLAI